MKHFLTLFLTLTYSYLATGQVLDLNQPLVEDTSIKKGVLSNGLTYYIKSTDVVKDAASYYIIQNVGSILEDDDQQGLAHFLEHMAFNGTKNFPGKSLLNTLQEHGAVFGKDINAYTSFDETVYNLSHIPTKDGLVDTCLTVLNDWSNYLLLTEEEIDAERGVIKEEWRTRQNGRTRLYKTSMPIVYNHSKYANRLPIGLMSVVENFEYKALRDFYHDWYRTDLQAIAIIGDVDVQDIEQKIIEKFSKIQAVKNPRKRFVVDIPNNDEMLYSLGMDPEISTASIRFGVRHKKPVDINTIAHLKRSLLESMVTSMLNTRISEQAQKPETTFLNAGVYYSSISRTSNTFGLGVSPKPNQQKEAFSQALTEVIRAVKFGFTQSEIDREIVELKNSYENRITKKEDASHRRILGGIQRNYLENESIADIEKEYEAAVQIFKGITKEEFHETIKRLYSKNNRTLNITGVASQENLAEDVAKQIIASVENNSEIKPYSESTAGKTLISGLSIKAGNIEKTTLNKETGATTYLLHNGIKVHYKFVDKEKDKVSLRALSYGGASLLSDEDLPSAELVNGLINRSGLGEFNATDLDKVLAGKTANVNINFGDITESLSGSSNTKDVETMLQMVYMYFEKPRFDEQAFKVLESNIDNYIIRRSNNIGEKMRDSLTVTLYGKNNPKERIFNQDYANDISFEKIKTIYKDRFADASDFEFFIVGDVKENQLTPLLETYIASLNTKKTKETFKDNKAEWVSNNIDKQIYLAMEDPKATINIAYNKEMLYTKSNAIYTDALGDILQLRITETVREAEGGAYSPRANASFSREPRSQVNISFRFDCNPDMADKLVDVVNAELQKIANGNIKEEDLNKVRKNFIKEREQAKDRNGYDMQVLTEYFRYNENMNDPKNFENIVNKISKKDIQNIVKHVLDGGKSYEVVFKPKQ
ncbi:insulinase family protein [Flavivirga aquimarina]|uniref:Insulinase family protein n=1 Tax=Flavivirga aquimarina TaxID=2027862 RepID=A0ABT8WAU2_9FLAO|nr:M16 family metallopeptidase [Flavivirga aquimarina]MDO5970255.1 insulinase family protein [Flavivirga aquimarina]